MISLAQHLTVLCNILTSIIVSKAAFLDLREHRTTFCLRDCSSLCAAGDRRRVTGGVWRGGSGEKRGVRRGGRGEVQKTRVQEGRGFESFTHSRSSVCDKTEACLCTCYCRDLRYCTSS